VQESLLVVLRLLGHADPAMTARIYLHATKDALDAVAAEQQRRIDAAAAQVSHWDSTELSRLDSHRKTK